ncbi:unnamed protein product [Umbelopsis vinacea]
MSQALDHNKVKVLAGNEAGVEIKFYLKPGAPSQPVFFQNSTKISFKQPPPPPLPTGWIAQWEPSQGRYFYANTATGHTQWEIPNEPATTGEANSYQAPPPNYTTSSSQTPDQSTDRGLGSFISGAMGGGRPQNNYGYGYPNNYSQGQNYNQGQGYNQNHSGFPGGGSMGGAIGGALLGLAAGKLMGGGGHHHGHHQQGLFHGGSFMPPPVPYGGFLNTDSTMDIIMDIIMEAITATTMGTMGGRAALERP